MLVKFDQKKLERLLDDFNKVSHITVSIWDNNYNQLAYRPLAMPKFCHMIKTSQEGNDLCKKSDRELCEASYREKKSVARICHAGLIDVAAPIINNGHLLGFMMFGQVVDIGHPVTDETLRASCTRYGFDEKEFFDAYKLLSQASLDLIQSLTRILEACVCHIWSSNMIKPEFETLVIRLDEYIHSHLAGDLSIKTLCNHFHLSKNQLYNIFRKQFGNKVLEYITECRISAAKEMLANSSEPLYRICEAVGIPDYNYFTKVFKKVTGTTPSFYRKHFPLLLNENK